MAGCCLSAGAWPWQSSKPFPAPDAAFSFATQLNKNAAIRRTFAALTGIR